MKLKAILSTGMLALVGSMLTTKSAQAAGLPYTNGDIFLAFRPDNGNGFSGTGSGSDILVDLGAASSFKAGGAPVTLHLAGLATDLKNTYGTGWASNGLLAYAIVGAAYNTAANGDPANTVYATYDAVNLGLSDWAALGGSQVGTASKINNMATAYKGYSAATNPAAAIQGNSDTNSYYSYSPDGTSTNSNGISFTVFNPTIETDGVSNPLRLDRIVPGSGGVLQGTFGGVTDSGGGVASLTFTPVAAPEPASSALLALGFGIFGMLHRRSKSTYS